MRNVLAIALALLCSCSDIEPEPPVGQDGEPVELPEPYDTWLRVIEIQPASGEISAQPVFEIEFDTYIEDDLLLSYDMVSLVSGGIRVRGFSTWDVTTRTLTWRPSSSLVDGLEYRLQLNAERLRSITGAPPQLGGAPTYTVDAELEASEPSSEQPATRADVEKIILRKCASCHRDAEWKLNPLTAESMIGIKAADRDQLLVIRRDAADSYLMHKILPDYPLRAYGVQPPTWSDAQPLTTGEIRTFKRWIDAGAP